MCQEGSNIYIYLIKKYGTCGPLRRVFSQKRSVQPVSKLTGSDVVDVFFRNVPPRRCRPRPTRGERNRERRTAGCQTKEKLSRCVLCIYLHRRGARGFRSAALRCAGHPIAITDSASRAEAAFRDDVGMNVRTVPCCTFTLFGAPALVPTSLALSADAPPLRPLSTTCKQVGCPQGVRLW